MILVIDNYDSFTYNLVQYMGEVTNVSRRIEVVRNDCMSVDNIREMNPRHIVISPGPCTPNEAGISMNVARELGPSIPILGVCLGHQAIAQAYGANVVRAPLPVHGKTCLVHHDGKGIFKNIAQDFSATRYHSLVLETETLPKEFEVSAVTENDVVMAIRHREYPYLIGVQFHPESILTSQGKALLLAFLSS